MVVEAGAHGQAFQLHVVVPFRPGSLIHELDPVPGIQEVAGNMISQVSYLVLVAELEFDTCVADDTDVLVGKVARHAGVEGNGSIPGREDVAAPCPEPFEFPGKESVLHASVQTDVPGAGHLPGNIRVGNGAGDDHAHFLSVEHQLVRTAGLILVGGEELECGNLVVTLLAEGSTELEVGEPGKAVFDETFFRKPPADGNPGEEAPAAV